MSGGAVKAEATTMFTTNISTTDDDLIFDTSAYGKKIDIGIYGEGSSDIANVDSYKTIYTEVVGSHLITGGTWSLRSDWGNTSYVKWNSGGTLYIVNVLDGSDAAKSITSAFQKKFGTGTKLVFAGAGAASSNVFKLNHVADLEAQGSLYDGKIVTTEILHIDSGKALILASSSGDLDISTGFAGVVGATGISVKDGKKLTLVGNTASIATMAFSTRADATPTGTTADSNITLTNGHLALGIESLAATQGNLKAISADKNSTVSVDNGLFKMTDLTGEGSVTIGEPALLIADSMTANTVVNSGDLKVTGKTTLVKTTPTTKASFLSSKASSTGAIPTLVNGKKGTMALGDLEVLEGTIENSGTFSAANASLGAETILYNTKDATATFDTLTTFGAVANQGTVTVNGTMTATAAVTELAGTWRVARFMLAGAENPDEPSDNPPDAGQGNVEKPNQAIRITNSFYADELNLQKGDFEIVKGGTMAGKNLVGNRLGARVKVADGGTFGFAYGERELKSLLDDYKGDKDGKAVLALNQSITVNDDGRLTVGSVAKETAAVNLGKNALMLVGTTSLSGAPFLKGSATQALHAEKGAQIAFTDDWVWGNHYLFSGFDKASMDEISGIGISDKNGNILKTNANDRGVYVTIGSADIRDKDSGYGLVNSMNYMLDGRQKLESNMADQAFLTQALLSGGGAKATRDAESLALQAGVFQEAIQSAELAHRTVMDHAAEAGSLDKAQFWAAGIWQTKETKDFGASSGYDLDTTGLAFGLDVPNRDVSYGAAFTAQKGDLDAHETATSGDTETYGISFYAKKRFENGASVAGGLSWTAGTNELSQQNLVSFEGKTDVESVIGSLIAAHDFSFRLNDTDDGIAFKVKPFIGIEAQYARADGFTTKVEGADAFEYGSQTGWLFRVPVGLTAGISKEDAASKTSWFGDVSVSIAPQFGDRDGTYSVTAANFGTTDAFSADSADSWQSRVGTKLGMETESLSFSLRYDAGFGSLMTVSHEVKAEATYRF